MYNTMYICKSSTPIMTQPTPRDHDQYKLDSTLPENAPTQVFTFPAQWFLQRFFLNANKFLMNCYYLLLKERVALYFNKVEFYSPPKNALCQMWLLEKKIKNVKNCYQDVRFVYVSRGLFISIFSPKKRHYSACHYNQMYMTYFTRFYSEIVVNQMQIQTLPCR